MKRAPLLRVMAIAAVLAVPAVSVLAADPRPPFKALRYEEDYRFLRDPALRTDPWDAVKYIPLADGHAGYLSFGGELRERFETYENEFFRRDPDADNAYLIRRYLLHADYHASDWLRVFVQLQSSLEDGRPGGSRPTDRDQVDVHQLFMDVVLLRDSDCRIECKGGGYFVRDVGSLCGTIVNGVTIGADHPSLTAELRPGEKLHHSRTRGQASILDHDRLIQPSSSCSSSHCFPRLASL